MVWLCESRFISRQQIIKETLINRFHDKNKAWKWKLLKKKCQQKLAWISYRWIIVFVVAQFDQNSLFMKFIQFEQNSIPILKRSNTFWTINTLYKCRSSRIQFLNEKKDLKKTSNLNSGRLEDFTSKQHLEISRNELK